MSKIKAKSDLEDVEQFIKKVELPKRIYQGSQEYSRILDSVSKKDVGSYSVVIPPKEQATIYQGLVKELKKKKDIHNIKIHFLSKKVYLEVI